MINGKTEIDSYITISPTGPTGPVSPNDEFYEVLFAVSGTVISTDFYIGQIIDSTDAASATGFSRMYSSQINEIETFDADTVSGMADEITATIVEI